jgi:hypothetical protein
MTSSLWDGLTAPDDNRDDNPPASLRRSTVEWLFTAFGSSMFLAGGEAVITIL